jgi:hypothetical protein
MQRNQHWATVARLERLNRAETRARGVAAPVTFGYEQF